MKIKKSAYQENPSLLFQNPEIESAFKEIAVYKEYPKNYLLCKTGVVCNHFYIIISGMTRMFYYKEGKDITVHFCIEQETASVFESLVKREKSKFNIETLEPVKAYEVSFKDFEDLVSKNCKFERFGRLFVQQLHINLIERINDLHFHNATERYESLFDKKPELFQRASLGQLASYLNITPETLSRIRGK
ncbi:Crp/Fnr family transcriptional regulator [Aquimarina addita]|uniref:Crp/Fnr family transcriptional regulator n=1 Tax=Aquimarina addita TaxID=870485 RepID=A0ABP6UU59_9FLAO